MAADLEHINDSVQQIWNSFQKVHAHRTRVLPWEEGSVSFYFLTSAVFFQFLENTMAPVIPSLSLSLGGTVANLRPRDGFQIQYSSTRSADLLGFDLFQLFSVLLTHGSNASQMYQAEWLDRLTSGKEQRLRKSKREKRGEKKVTQRLKKTLKCEGVIKPGCTLLFCHCYNLKMWSVTKQKTIKNSGLQWRVLL